MIKKGCFWIDIHDPTDSEMKALCKVFRIHPLTVEDISMEEQREKCEVFMNYYFVCFRSFDQDEFSATYMQPSALYIIILKEGVLTVGAPPPFSYASFTIYAKQLQIVSFQINASSSQCA